LFQDPSSGTASKVFPKFQPGFKAVKATEAETGVKAAEQAPDVVATGVDDTGVVDTLVVVFFVVVLEVVLGVLVELVAVFVVVFEDDTERVETERVVVGRTDTVVVVAEGLVPGIHCEYPSSN
jgi:hypothetical protein